jgi:hypothetical protein
MMRKYLEMLLLRSLRKVGRIILGLFSVLRLPTGVIKCSV